MELQFGKQVYERALTLQKRGKDTNPLMVYNELIYPVFANQRCRQNVTGIPSDEELARTHVQVFAEQCY